MASLRDLLEPPSPRPRRSSTAGSAGDAGRGHHARSSTSDDAAAWYQGALGELHATLAAQRLDAAGPPGGIFANELFTDERGEATIFVPVARAGPADRAGRVRSSCPAPSWPSSRHAGSHADIDRAYGALATYVAEHALAVEGPIREYYLVGRHDTADETAWRTEIGWPVFATGPA